MTSMHETAKALVAPAKGILAADESTGTIKKRFDSIGVESTEETRRRYRQLLFSTPGLGDHISGVILFDETIRQSADDGRTFVDVLREAGIREPEAHTLLRIVTSRIGGGELGLTARNRNGVPRPTGRSVSWLDTREGRYLLRKQDGWLVLAPADAPRLTSAVDELLAAG